MDQLHNLKQLATDLEHKIKANFNSNELERKIQGNFNSLMYKRDFWKGGMEIIDHQVKIVLKALKGMRVLKEED